MSTNLETNKETIRRLTESFNALDRETFDTCYAEHIVVHSSRGKDRTMDHNAHWKEVLGMFRVYPDLNAKIENMVAEDDRVFVRWTYAGTHEGRTETGLFDPTGKRAAWAAWCEYRLEGGRVVEAWNIADSLYRLEQLGLVELPTQRQDKEPAEEPRSENVIRIKSSPPTT